MISGYEGAPVPLSNPLLLLLNRIRIEGFVAGEDIDLWPQALEELAALVADRMVAGVAGADRRLTNPLFLALSLVG
jgi:NADPH-dependent curcumin reductase CurA